MISANATMEALLVSFFQPLHAAAPRQHTRNAMSDFPKTVQELEVEYLRDEWSYINAIQCLQDHFGYTSREAEIKVDSWED